MSHETIAVVAIARCQITLDAYGIRFEQVRPGHWVGDWTFALEEARAKREHFDRTFIEGEITLAPAYPGCSFCRARSFFLCRCGKLSCWDGEVTAVLCSWCRQLTKITDTIHSLEVGRDT